MRAKAIHTVVKIYRPVKFPIDKFTELLAFDDNNDTLSFLSELCLRADADGKLELISGYQAFSDLSGGSKYGNKVVEDKLTKPLSEVITPSSKTLIPHLRLLLAELLVCLHSNLHLLLLSPTITGNIHIQ